MAFKDKRCKIHNSVIIPNRIKDERTETTKYPLHPQAMWKFFCVPFVAFTLI
jgi:hypothetical protein